MQCCRFGPLRSGGLGACRSEQFPGDQETVQGAPCPAPIACTLHFVLTHLRLHCDFETCKWKVHPLRLLAFNA